MVDTIKDYMIFKLVTSELVIAKFIKTDDLGYHVEQPRVFNISYVKDGQASMAMYLTALNPFSKNEEYVFKKFHVVFMEPVTDPYIAIYYSDHTKIVGGGSSSGGTSESGSPKRDAGQVLSELVRPEVPKGLEVN